MYKVAHAWVSCLDLSLTSKLSHCMYVQIFKNTNASEIWSPQGSRFSAMRYSVWTSKDLEIITWSEKRALQLESTITWNNTFTRKFHHEISAKRSIEDGSIDCIHSQQQQEIWIKKEKQNWRGLPHIIRWTAMNTMSTPEGEVRKGKKKYLKKQGPDTSQLWWKHEANSMYSQQDKAKESMAITMILKLESQRTENLDNSRGEGIRDS